MTVGTNDIRTWIAERDSDKESHTFLIRITRDGDVIGWQSAYLGGVLDALSDQSYAEVIGEEADDIAVWVLTDMGPLPITIISVRHEGAGFIERQVFWRDPLVKGKRAMVSVTGYTKIIDA